MDISTDFKKAKCFTLKQSFTPSPLGEKADGIKNVVAPSLFTNTVTVSFAMQLVTKSVPVTKYSVVVAGLAIGLAIALLFKLPPGDHAYWPAPVTDNCAFPILQFISFDFEALIVGIGNTVMLVVSVAELLQANSFIKTVYVVLAFPVVLGLAMLGLLTNATGLQEYKSPPDAFNCTAVLKQVVSTGEIVNNGCGFTVTFTESVDVQLLFPVTITL